MSEPTYSKVDFGWSYPPGCSSVPGDEEENKTSDKQFTDVFENEYGYTIKKFKYTKEPELVGKDEVTWLYCVRVSTTGDECFGIEFDLTFQEEHLRNEVYELLKHLQDVG